MIASNSGRMFSPLFRCVEHRVAVERRGKDYREVHLLLAGASLSNRSNVWLITQSGRAPGRSILLMTTIGFQAQRQRLARDEAESLRHRSFDGVDQQQAAVDHRQHAFDLAAEVGVARPYRRC